MINFKKLTTAFIAMTTACVLGGALGAGVGVTSASAKDIRIGGKDFTEQLIIAEITKQLLQSKGYNVVKNDGMGTKIVRAALENGEIDMYWEYTGTSLVTFNKVKDKLSPEQTYEKVKELDAKKGLVWLMPSKANNTYAMAIRLDNPKTDGMTTISDMAASYNASKPLMMGTTAEFPKRPDGLLGLQKVYGFEAGREYVKPMNLGLAYQALGQGDLDVVSAQATDGMIAAMHLKLLKDDKNFFPNYALTPVVRQDFLDANPDVKGILESVSAKLTDDQMQKLNGEVDVEKKTIEAVASEFLKASNLM